MADKENIVIMHERNMEKTSVRQKAGKAIVMFLTYLFLVVMALAVLFPFYWMINSSLKSIEEYRLSVP